MQKTLSICACLALALAAAPASASTKLEGVVPVEYQPEEKRLVKMADRLRDLRRGATLAVDLAFDLDAAPGNGKSRLLKRDIAFGTDAEGDREELPCLTDEVYDLDYTGAHFFSLKLFENFETIMLRVYPGDKTAFPMNDVACIHAPDAPGTKRFRITGRYIAMPVSTPNGVVLQLRPAR
jgi:hypothetical protein